MWEQVNIRRIPSLAVVWQADSVRTKCSDISKKKNEQT
jgi:hypothetical protein